ncbi:MAG TPA: DUF5668 domain-containing protein [Candidatus Polarisedimenticolaceae bacterium]|nr:DUF5668 domain-containing protein [Candidatus Polarisedimenticolaceae bacterium]
MNRVETVGPEDPALQSPPSPPPGWTYNPPPRVGDPRRKQPLLACFLSLMPGLGQIYVGYYRRGFVHAIVVCTLITLLSSNVIWGAEPLFGVFLGFFWMYNIIDAGRRAALYNYALDGIAKIDLPEDGGSIGMQGTIGGGLLLIVLGAVALSHTLFGYSLSWVRDYWPLLPIGLGVYLLAKGMMDRK